MRQKNWFQILVVAVIFALGFFYSSFNSVAGLQTKKSLLALHDEQDVYLLGNYLEYLEDPSQTLNIQQISSPPYSEKFISGDADILNFGLKDSVYWLRLTVKNESVRQEHWALDLARPSMNSVFFYAPAPEGTGFTEIKTGYVFPFSTRDVPHENFIFNLNLAQHDEQTYYLRVKDISFDLPLRIWSDSAFVEHDHLARLAIAGSFGALFIMLIYTVILLFIIRDFRYIYYVFFQAFLILYLSSIQGYAPRYLWQNSISFCYFSIPLFLEISIIFLLLFTWDFLQVDFRSKWLAYTCCLLIAIFAISIPFTIYGGAKILLVILPLVLVAHVYAFILGIWAMWSGYRPARYYMFAWSFYLVFGFGAVLHHMGWVIIQNFIPEQAVQFGAVYLVTFQSLALADHINFYKQKHLTAQSRLIFQQRETLRLKDELNTTLEDRVLRRTRELIDLNTQLSAEIAERKHAENELKRLASLDFLTNLFNRRYFFEIANQEFAKSIRYHRALAVVIFDIDLFKNVNDLHGHLVGDRSLAHIGNLVRSITRHPDIPARYGGEEFIILLPETNCQNAQIFAERLRQLIQDSPAPMDNGSIDLTVSIGVSGKDEEENMESLDILISQADQSLYKAKSAGRNRTICYWHL